MSDDGGVAYEPRSVKAVLREMKDIAELLIDLSYSSVLFDDADLADEVLELEARMDVLQLQARMSLVLAGRSPDEAEALAPVFGIVGAAEKISDAAGDVAKVVREDVGLPAALRRSLPEAVETLARAELAPDSPYAGRTLGGIDLETETGVRVVAIRRDSDWIHSPDRETRLAAGDVAICRGPEAAIQGVYQTITGDQFERPAGEMADVDDLDRAVESVVHMKNMSELAVDLAYGSVLFDDADLAAEVRDLEVEVDALKSRFEAWALRAASEVADPVSLRGLIHIAASTEVVSDAAVEISEGVLRGLASHPVVAAAVEESDEVLVRVVVEPGSDLDGATVDDVAALGTGMHLLAVGRGEGGAGGDRSDGERDRPEDDRGWVVSPTGETAIRAGDRLIAKGTRAGAERLDALAE